MECKHLKLYGPCSWRCHNIGEYWDNYNDRKRKTVAQMIESATPNTVQTQPAGHNIRPADSTTSVSRDCDVHRSGPATRGSTVYSSPATSDSHGGFSEQTQRGEQLAGTLGNFNPVCLEHKTSAETVQFLVGVQHHKT